LRAEGDFVVCSGGAGECAALVVVGVAVGVWAEPLEETRVAGRPAGRRRTWRRAAVLWGAELAAGTHAAPVHLQLRRALCVDVRSAANRAAAAADGPEAHRHVESVDEGDVVEVSIAACPKSVFGERGGWLPAGTAGQHAAAVSRGTRPLAAGVEFAARTRPDPTRICAGGRVDCGQLAWFELGPASHRDGGWPHRVEHLFTTVMVAASVAATVRRRARMKSEDAMVGCC
uniref:Uncharacterized protein n=1 Tax=Triticum urartu TaxID=4572 RepID=A0A8R7U4P6_TRIUA